MHTHELSLVLCPISEHLIAIEASHIARLSAQTTADTLGYSLDGSFKQATQGVSPNTTQYALYFHHLPLPLLLSQKTQFYSCTSDQLYVLPTLISHRCQLPGLIAAIYVKEQKRWAWVINPQKLA